MWWRFDRAIRSLGDKHDPAKCAKAHRKTLVFAEGIGGVGTCPRIQVGRDFTAAEPGTKIVGDST
ncbi:hypothetical protein SSP531S_41090 [Streptomyces spongiicola]|uniref:Uncharacterized protein n=1 Tax=Streptomyces spongiicola TaxID=1690221 RepID=A0A388T1J4_9ACTN|nr:hypothetical protein SSP531S_41090 [Streptomyces spongiicola]